MIGRVYRKLAEYDLHRDLVYCAAAALPLVTKGVVIRQMGFRRPPTAAVAAAGEVLKARMGRSIANDLLLGLLLTAQKRLSEAVELLERCEARKPGFVPVLAALGNALSHAGEYERAVAILSDVARRAPRRAHVHYCLARSLVALGRDNEAVDALRTAAALRPKTSKILCALADLLLQSDAAKEARSLYVRAAHADPALLKRYWNGDPATRPDDALLAEMMVHDAAFRIQADFIGSGRGGRMMSMLQLGREAQDRARRLVDKEWPRRHGLATEYIHVLPPLWAQLVSHTASLDTYVKLQKLGWITKRRPLLLAPREQTANLTYLHYWSEYVDIVDDNETIKKMLPACFVYGEGFGITELRNGTSHWFHDLIMSVPLAWHKSGHAPLLRLREEHRERGWSVLDSAGIPRGAWFACLHVREGGFYREGSHPFAQFRNADIATFAQAAALIRARGGYVVRVGDKSMKPYPPTDGVFDYALSPHKSDWMDVFLCAACRFFIGSTSGLYLVPTSFGVPCVLANWLSFEPRAPDPGQIFIPKRLQCHGETIPFRESMSPDRKWVFNDGRLITRNGYTVIDNTPEEISEAVEEMIDRLDGRFILSERDAAFHKRFEALSTEYHISGAAKISTAFLRANEHLLA